MIGGVSTPSLLPQLQQTNTLASTSMPVAPQNLQPTQAYQTAQLGQTPNQILGMANMINSAAMMPQINTMAASMMPMTQQP